MITLSSSNYKKASGKVSKYTFLAHAQKITLIKLLEELKSHSSSWMKTKGVTYSNFSLQNDYGSFSVNPAEVERVSQYIANQKEHHSKKVFKDEYKTFLKKYDVAYDERYDWD